MPAGILIPALLGVLTFGFLMPAHVLGADASLEKRVESLEKTIEKLQHQATRAQDVLDIMYLQARYEAIHNSDESLGWMLFADRPDTTQEITHSRIIGFDNIKKSYLEGYKALSESEDLPEGTVIGWTGFAGMEEGAKPPEGMGGMRIHPIGTPCIVVADDGQTAKATFTSFGIEGPGWCYGKYANSYIKIDGKWYIWHMKWLRNFKINFYKAWFDQTLDEIYEFTQGKTDQWGFPAVNSEIDYSYLYAPGKEVETITAPKPYKTWTKEDENGEWWKRKTIEP